MYGGGRKRYGSTGRNSPTALDSIDDPRRKNMVYSYNM